MAEEKAAAAAAPARGGLNAAILELSGAQVEAQIRFLADFETHAAGSIRKQQTDADAAKYEKDAKKGAKKENITVDKWKAAHPAPAADAQSNQQSTHAASASWTSHAFLAPGMNPGAICDPALEGADDDARIGPCWRPDGPAAESIAIMLRQFSMKQFALVERAIHGQLLALWESIGDARKELRWHFICTMRRDAADFGKHAIHADTFDSTMVAFALTCNKIQTPIFPAAQFDPPAVQQFVKAYNGQDCRPEVIRLARTADGSDITGPPRPARDAVVTILPPAVAHSIPCDVALHEVESFDSQGRPLATMEDNRWFCRVSIEIIAGGVSQHGATDGGAWKQWKRPWPTAQLRRHVAQLAAGLVWGADDLVLALE